MKDFSPLAITSPVVGFPARIGEIERLDGTVIRFAESDEPLLVGGDTYAVVPGLALSAIKHTANGETPSCEINAVHGSGGVFDSEDIDIGLFDGAKVRVYVVDRANLSRKGRVFNGSISTIQYDPIERSLNLQCKGPSANSRIVMTQKRSPMCRTDLFSSLCQLDKTDFDVSTTVARVVDAFTFTVTGPLAQADGYFNQGVAVTADGVAIEIAKWVQSTQAITTYLPKSRVLSVGLGLTLYPGCDKTIATCKAKFNNTINFQGEPHFNGTAAAAQQV